MGSIEQEIPAHPPLPLEPSSLPQAGSSDIHLVQATELERTHCWTLNCNEWRGPLSPQQYYDREAHLERQSLVSDGKITFWILTLKSHPKHETKARPILASCETLLKPSFLAESGHLHAISAHGIGSVYCRKEYRGKGYANRMVSELGIRLGKEGWQQPKNSPGRFSILYSDIGQQFYARHNWKPMSSTHVALLPVDQKVHDETRSLLGLPDVKDLKAPDLAPICGSAIDQVRAELVQTSRQAPSGTSYVAVSPDLGHMVWHHAREEFQARTLFGTDPNIKGTIDRATGCALIWCRVWRGNNTEHDGIDILKTVIPGIVDDPSEGLLSSRTWAATSSLPATDQQAPNLSISAYDLRKSLAALLLRAQLEAANWKMQGGVEVWNPEGIVLEAAKTLSGTEKEVEVIIREKEHICSLRWEGQGEVEWLANEKYAWC